MASLPTEFCHASTVVELASGKRLCCWFGGSHEGREDVAIYISSNAGDGWSTPRKLVDSPAANWNPVLFKAQDRLLLFCKYGNAITSWQTLLLESTDQGATWSAPVELVPGDCSGGRGPVRNKPIRLSNGWIIAGGSTEAGIWQAFADISKDEGATWQRTAPIAIAGLTYSGEKTAESSIAVSQQSFYGRGVIQPSLWESAPGQVHMLLRSSEGYIYRSDSQDYGLTWTDAYSIGEPNNNSGLDLVRCSNDGCLYLVCNPVAANWGLRSPLSLLKSRDNGATWQRVLDLETQPGEFSYPAIIETGDGLCITYTWNRQNIACVQLGAAEMAAF